MSSNFVDAVRNRRSIYGLGNKLTISHMELELLLAQLIKDCPTAFNMQNTRMAVLMGESHTQAWDITWNCLQRTIPAEKLAKTRQKLDSFAAAYGTILFFDDTDITEQFAGQYPTYKEMFPDWSLQQSGMLQFAVWTALEDKNIGASLQHYNPLIDCDIKKIFEIPESWRLLAEMPFGSITAPPGEKTFDSIEKRLLFL